MTEHEQDPDTAYARIRELDARIARMQHEYDQDMRTMSRVFAQSMNEIAGILREACGIKPLEADELTRLSEVEVRVLYHDATPEQLAEYDALKHRHLDARAMAKHVHSLMQPRATAPDELYMLDTSRVAGDCAVWWGPAGKGYTSDLNKAGTFSREYIDTHRIADFPVRVDVARGVAVTHVRIDHLRRTGALAELDQRAADETSDDDDEPGVDVDYPHDCDLDAVRSHP